MSYSIVFAIDPSLRIDMSKSISEPVGATPSLSDIELTITERPEVSSNVPITWFQFLLVASSSYPIIQIDEERIPLTSISEREYEIHPKWWLSPAGIVAPFPHPKLDREVGWFVIDHRTSHDSSPVIVISSNPELYIFAPIIKISFEVLVSEFIENGAKSASKYRLDGRFSGCFRSISVSEGMVSIPPIIRIT